MRRPSRSCPTEAEIAGFAVYLRALAGRPRRRTRPRSPSIEHRPGGRLRMSEPRRRHPARCASDVAALHAELIRYGLVIWTGGNISGRVPGADLFVIKPSGVVVRRPRAREHDPLRPRRQRRRPARPAPSAAPRATPPRTPTCTGTCPRSAESCTPTRPTPPPGPPAARPSRASSPAMADEFGGEIPVGPFAIIGDDSIGRGIVATLDGHRSRAVLMQNHGVFTIGKDAKDAVKAAVMCEDVARTIHISRQLGDPLPIPQESIDALFDRYQNVYGQAPQGELEVTSIVPDLEEVHGLVPHRQPGPLRRGDPPPGRRAVAARSRGARRLGRRAGDHRVEAGAHRLRRDPPRRARRERRRLGHRRSSPGCTPSAPRRCGSRASTRCRSRCCTCTRRRTSTCRGARSTSTS